MLRVVDSTGQRKKYVMTDLFKKKFWNYETWDDMKSIYGRKEANKAMGNCIPACFVEVQVQVNTEFLAII